VTARGYRSLAVDYLQASASADPRLADVALTRIDVDVSVDPWWVAYRVARLEPAPDVVAFPVYCWTARHVYETVRIVKAQLPSAQIVLGGPEVGPIAQDVLATRPGVGAVVRGEGEFAFCDLLWAYARGGDPGAVPGVTALVDGAIVAGPDREPIAEMDSIPSPFQGRTHATDGSAYVETFRGCPHRCAYCFEGKGSTRIRSFSWERIAADVDAVASTPGIRSFSFIDPVFNLTAERLERLAGIMAPHVTRGVRLHTIEVDIERVDAAQAALLVQAGVASVETGPQTIGASALEACGRGFDPEHFRAGVAACRSVGISVECDIIVGLPGDTVDDVLATIDFAIGLDPGIVQLSTLHVLPGTDLWRRAADFGLVYDAEPPHELIASREIGFTELRRIEELGRAAAAVYRARIEPERG
jgi:anaerobic magnesium-protoporphyrin IX monomethyl ester cyclase